MDYQYIGCTEDRKMVKGTLAAASQEAATKILTSQGYQVFSLKPVPAFMPSREQIFPARSKVKPEVIIVFSRQLALLLEAGNDIVNSLELLQAQSSNNYFKKIMGEIISDLRGGSGLSTALRNHPKVFSKVYIQSVSAGEQGGHLETVLRQVADYMEKDVQAAKKIKGALRYPIIVSIVAFVVIGIIIVFVLPAFTDLYSSLGAELPPLTKMTLSAFQWLTNYGLYLMVVAFLMAGLGYIYTKTPAGKLLRDRITLKLPLFGRSNHLNELIRCCRSMSLLYRAGLPVPKIMSLVIENSTNLVIKNALTQVQEDVMTGEGLSQSMAKNEYFLPMMVQMVGVGETTGNLDIALMATAENFETDAEDKMRSLIGFIQPALTLFISIIVAFIALSLVTAMYSIYGEVI